MNPNQVQSIADSVSYHKVLYTQRTRKINFQYEDLEIHVNYTTYIHSFNKETLCSINWIFVVEKDKCIKTISSDTQEELIRNKNIYNLTVPVYGNLYLSDIRQVILESLKREGVYAE